MLVKHDDNQMKTDVKFFRSCFQKWTKTQTGQCCYYLVLILNIINIIASDSENLFIHVFFVCFLICSHLIPPTHTLSRTVSQDQFIAVCMKDQDLLNILTKGCSWFCFLKPDGYLLTSHQAVTKQTDKRKHNLYSPFHSSSPWHPHPSILTKFLLSPLLYYSIIS